MQWLILDYETYYDDQYSLRKLIPPNYILDPRYETNIVAVQEGLDGKPDWVDGPAFPDYLKRFDPKNTVTITFNALFDNCILGWRYGFVPALMIDVMGMARALHGHELRYLSLEKVAEHFGIGQKGKTLLKVKGMRRDQIMAQPELWKEYCAYAMQDVHLTAELYKIMAREFPKSEYAVMDLVLRCAVEPRLCIDAAMLEKHMVDVGQDKADLLAAAGNVAKGDLMSTEGFRAALEAEGVEVEEKTTPAGNVIPAFAKTDDFMEKLSNHEDPRVQALAAARLGHKSTLEETRGNRLLSLAQLDWSATGCLGTLPIPLRYAGAHTHRLSGDWKLNMQNLPAGRGTQVSKLRKAVIAPPGHGVVKVDLGQIEARITAWLCGQADLLQQFAEGQDPYAKLGSKIFGFEVDRKVHIIEGHIGKGGVLGLGFGCGPPKFYGMVLRQARGMGMDMAALGKIWTLDLAKKSVRVYRNANRNIKNAWDTLDFILQSSWAGLTAPVSFGPVVVGEGYVRGPGGLEMRYLPDEVLEGENNYDKGYRYGERWHKIYGSAFLENIVQFLARIVCMNAAVRLAGLGYPFAGQEHDALIFVVRLEDIDNAKKIIHSEMVKRPSWAPELPLKADIGHGPSFGDAK